MTTSLIEAPVDSQTVTRIEHRATDRALECILDETASTVGDQFLLRLVGRLGSVLRVRYALVVGAPSDGPSLLAFWIAREYGARVESGLWGPRPEGFSLEGGAGYHRVLRALLGEGVRRSLGGCRGVPLVGEGERPIGHLVVLDRDADTDPVDVVAVLSAMAPRVATEVARRTGAPLLDRALPGRPSETQRRLVTVCAWCERVRDDRRMWRELAGYVRERMSVGFTHGICPDCLRQHRP
jgi:hypothetical protein